MVSASFIKDQDLIQQMIDRVCRPAELHVDGMQEEEEGEEYAAHAFSLNHQTKALFRVAKTTPKKIGQFVTLWKRPFPNLPSSAPGNKPAAIHVEDGIEFVVVMVQDKTQQGYFIFNAASLLANGIMARKAERGKTAFRVYPPWSKVEAKDAIKTQRWQVRYFLPVNENGYADPAHVHKLFGLS